MEDTSPAAKLRRLARGELGDRELQAAFLAAREYGKVLQDEVLAAIVQAVVTADDANAATR